MRSCVDLVSQPLTSPVSLLSLVALRLQHQLGPHAVAVTARRADGHRSVVFNAGYQPSVISYLSSEFVVDHPAYRDLVAAGGAVLTWDDVAGFRQSEPARGVFARAGLRQGSTVPLVDQQGRDLGDLHMNFMHSAVPRDFRAATARAAQEARPLLTALWERQEVRLTPRQLETLSLLSRGLSNRHIARALGVSGRTVDAHVARICAELGVHTRLQATTKALRLGLVGLHEDGCGSGSGPADPLSCR